MSKKKRYTLEELEQKFGGKVNVLKVNVDENQELAQEYDVRGIPALFFFKGGELKAQLAGNLPQQTLEDTIQDIL